MAKPSLVTANSISFGKNTARYCLDELSYEPDFTKSSKEWFEYQRLAHPRRKAEYATIRKMKNGLFPNDHIEYANNGKPYLAESPLHISISHSLNFGLFAFGPDRFGCDIEEPNERLNRVYAKFTSEIEINTLKGLDRLDQLCILWTCKEAIYKLMDRSGVDWKKDCQCVGGELPELTFRWNHQGESALVQCYVIPYAHQAWISFAFKKTNG